MADQTITIKATMNERWMAQFLGLLRHMETNGFVGHSEVVGFFVDGDGDLRPHFEWETDTKPAFPHRLEQCASTRLLFDAG